MPSPYAGSSKEQPKDIENGGGETNGEGEADKGADGIPNPNKAEDATAAPIKTPDGKEEQVDFKTLTAEEAFQVLSVRGQTPTLQIASPVVGAHVLLLAAMKA